MRIVCLGDSLTYGYGVKRASVWTVLASRAMTGCEIVNRGISGDTAGGMLSRFETDVAGSRPDMAFIMGGSNDIFFSGSISEAESSMAAMVFRREKLSIAAQLRKGSKQAKEHQEPPTKKSGPAHVER